MLYCSNGGLHDKDGELPGKAPSYLPQLLFLATTTAGANCLGWKQFHKKTSWYALLLFPLQLCPRTHFTTITWAAWYSNFHISGDVKGCEINVSWKQKGDCLGTWGRGLASKGYKPASEQRTKYNNATIIPIYFSANQTFLKRCWIWNQRTSDIQTHSFDKHLITYKGLDLMLSTRNTICNYM